MKRTKLVCTMILVAGGVATAPASAQSASASRTSETDTLSVPAAMTSAQVAGPRLEVTATAMRHLTRTTEPLAFQRVQPMSMGKPVALMIVGGAAIVLGAVIGGDPGTLFMIGGSASLLFGLYQYLK
jgi:6-phosphofructokinase